MKQSENTLFPPQLLLFLLLFIVKLFDISDEELSCSSVEEALINRIALFGVK